MPPARGRFTSTHFGNTPWALHILAFSLGIAALIKLLRPEVSFLSKFLISCGYGLSIYYLSRVICWLRPQMPIWKGFAIATPAGVVIGSVLGVYVFSGGTGGVPLLKTFLLSGGVISLIGAALFYTRGKMLHFQSELRDEQLRRANQEKLLAESRLLALQAQIEPHFIFNTLANVQGLIDTDPKAAKAMLETFTELLRHTLERSRGEATTLGQELEIVRRYLAIQRMRLGERLNFQIDVPEALLGTRFPALLLQPLVENAIQHGIEPAVAGGEVRVRAEVDAGRLRIVAEDTGQGFGAGTAGNGIGLKNVRERLAARYGDAASLSLTENAPRGVRATLELPHE